MKALLIAALLLSACAHTPATCPTARQVIEAKMAAKRKGYRVLNCYVKTYQDSGETVDVCRVQVSRSMIVERHAFARHCGLE